MKTYIKQSITQVRKAIKDNGIWCGLLVGNKVSQFHFEDGWNLAIYHKFRSTESLQIVRDAELLNTPKELGNNIAFYVIKDDQL